MRKVYEINMMIANAIIMQTALAVMASTCAVMVIMAGEPAMMTAHGLVAGGALGAFLSLRPVYRTAIEQKRELLDTAGERLEEMVADEPLEDFLWRLSGTEEQEVSLYATA